jgi:hypothetical protein
LATVRQDASAGNSKGLALRVLWELPGFRGSDVLLEQSRQRLRLVSGAGGPGREVLDHVEAFCLGEGPGLPELWAERTDHRIWVMRDWIGLQWVPVTTGELWGGVYGQVLVRQGDRLHCWRRGLAVGEIRHGFPRPARLVFGWTPGPHGTAWALVAAGGTGWVAALSGRHLAVQREPVAPAPLEGWVLAGARQLAVTWRSGHDILAELRAYEGWPRPRVDRRQQWQRPDRPTCPVWALTPQGMGPHWVEHGMLMTGSWDGSVRSQGPVSHLIVSWARGALPRFQLPVCAKPAGRRRRLPAHAAWRRPPGASVPASDTGVPGASGPADLEARLARLEATLSQPPSRGGGHRCRWARRG